MPSGSLHDAKASMIQDEAIPPTPGMQAPDQAQANSSVASVSSTTPGLRKQSTRSRQEV